MKIGFLTVPVGGRAQVNRPRAGFICLGHMRLRIERAPIDIPCYSRGSGGSLLAFGLDTWGGHQGLLVRSGTNFPVNKGWWGGVHGARHTEVQPVLLRPSGYAARP